MFRKAFSKALLLQLNKSACHSVQPRPLRTPVLRSLQQCQNNFTSYGVRTFATIPSSAVVKQASTENGIDISERAIKQLKYIQKRDKDEDQLLRVLVDSGGCHGYQNKMELTNTVDEDDTIFEKEGVKVVIDAVSLQFLRGSMVDYVQELIGSTFQVVDNPNAKHSCGCNISYDIDLDKIY
ncbi:hypothetical protein INT47_011485 [Mucor saturninus]|uniref:Core domain-containing protein n=1 Tax=Mucor saturninus TaxID=64648 RepID=A0A8H7UUE5_9FUNG|nr:hypothetical protein INT47_011485 [Mucor saturninus]